MNHYINLLEPSEIKYESKAAVSPKVKLLGIGVTVLLAGFLGMKYFELRSKAAEGEYVSSTWKRIEKDVEAANDLNVRSLRLEKGLETLEGWPKSRHDWPALIEYFAEKSPVSPENLQFTSFSFDENILGLREKIPGTSKSTQFPLKRQVSINLKGKLQSDKPQLMLPEYRREIANGQDAPSAIEDVTLANPQLIVDANGNPTGLSLFSLQIELKDQEVKP